MPMNLWYIYLKMNLNLSQLLYSLQRMSCQSLTSAVSCCRGLWHCVWNSTLQHWASNRGHVGLEKTFLWSLSRPLYRYVALIPANSSLIDFILEYLVGCVSGECYWNKGKGRIFFNLRSAVLALLVPGSAQDISIINISLMRTRMSSPVNTTH